jgi:hypothetical protein
MSDNFKYTKSMIEWRRNMVISYIAKGWSQQDIAKELKLHPSTISLDVQYLKEKAQKDLENHIQERLPFEYSRAMTGINTVLKRVSEILDNATDTKTKMECMKLQLELYKSIMLLATDGGIVERAMKIVKTLEPQPAETAEEDHVNVKEESDDSNNIPTEEDVKEEE